MRVRVRLSETELQRAEQIGRQRNAENRRVGRHSVILKESLERDLVGAAGELAVSLYFGIKWDGQFFDDERWQAWRRDGSDVGRLEVRTTAHAHGRLLLHPADKDHAPFVLVLAHASPSFTLVGWIYGRDGKRDAFWRDVGTGRPCYYVPQDALFPIGELTMQQAQRAIDFESAR